MQLSIAPELSLTDEPIPITVSGVAPAAEVTVRSHLVDRTARRWVSRGVYVAGKDGVVNLTTDPSINGTYKGVDPLGLFWSMMPSSRDPDVLGAEGNSDSEEILAPQVEPEELHDVSFIAESEGKQTAPVVIRRTWVKPGTRTEEVSDGVLRGVYYEPPGVSSGSPAALVIPGSDGGVSTTLAPLLASHGIATLALAYFGYKDLPSVLVDIPLEYFAAAADWVRRRSACTRLVAIGISYGAIAAALSATRFLGFADRLVLYVPGPLVQQGIDPARIEPVAAWRYAGEPLAFPHRSLLPNARSVIVQRGMSQLCALSFSQLYYEEWVQRDVERRFGIPVERIGKPILLFSGTEDALWPSSLGAARIEARIKAHRPDVWVKHVAFEGAGHFISRPGLVTSMSTAIFHPLAKTLIALGGSSRANAAASLAALSDTINFIGSASVDQDGTTAEL